MWDMTVDCTPEYPDHHPRPSARLHARNLAERAAIVADHSGEKDAGFVGNPSKPDPAMLARTADDLEICI
ncbi:hypothetical protein [uncultured Paracoccus sp.]|uniref:hypothetical protein n=1 Tax=uncultured Paracoccus sp. TaxID=189685 RepID=UPI0025D78B3C|nr:hypothetical protein [uncultured Paracoccus sp.]